MDEVRDACAGGFRFQLAVDYACTCTAQLTETDKEKLRNLDPFGSLEQIKGIGPRSAGVWRDNGIYTVAQLVGEALVWAGNADGDMNAFAEAVQDACKEARAAQWASTVIYSIIEIISRGIKFDY